MCPKKSLTFALRLKSLSLVTFDKIQEWTHLGCLKLQYNFFYLFHHEQNYNERKKRFIAKADFYDGIASGSSYHYLLIFSKNLAL